MWRCPDSTVDVSGTERDRIRRARRMLICARMNITDKIGRRDVPLAQEPDLSFSASLPHSRAPALAQGNVDTVVTNGKILTVDADFRVVEALAISDGRIVASGTSAEVAR